jgi:hypothetical protein
MSVKKTGARQASVWGAVRWGGAAMIDGDEWRELAEEADAFYVPIIRPFLDRSQTRK